MGRATLAQSEPRASLRLSLPVYGQAHIGGVLIFLAVVFPPAHGAQRKDSGVSSVLYPQHGQRY